MYYINALLTNINESKNKFIPINILKHSNIFLLYVSQIFNDFALSTLNSLLFGIQTRIMGSLITDFHGEKVLT
jgi:hypothetical protein